MIYAFNSVINIGGDNTFSGNSLNARGNSYGAIYAATPYQVREYGKPTDNYENVINFGNNTLFKQNSAVYGSAIVSEASIGGAIVFMADKDDPNNVHDVLNFAPQKAGQYVRFEGNKYGNTLNSMYLNNTQLNFNLQKGT